MITSARLTFGQLAILRDVEPVPRDRWHEPNLAEIWTLPVGTTMIAVREALAVLVRRHESLRTTYDLTGSGGPRQLLHQPEEPVVQVERTADPRIDLHAVLRQQSRQPFNLVRELPWQVTVVTSGANPTHLVLVNHHIVADGLAVAALKRNFFAALAGTVDDAVSGPRVIVTHEQSPAGLRRGEAAIGYWTKVLTEVPAPIIAEPPFVEATLVSETLMRAARQVAAGMRVSVPIVVLSAFCAALFQLTDGDRLAVRMLSSNRFDPYRQDIVTSMNQWVPILVDRSSQPDVRELIRQVGKRTRTAYAYGVYDVDRVFRLLDQAGYRPGQYDSTWSFNFVSRRPDEPPPPESPGLAKSSATPESATPDAATAQDEPIAWASPFSSVGPRCYLRAIEGADLRLELRVPASQSAIAAGLIRRMRRFLVDASRTC